jgi:sulfite exporter TauE/SafE
MFDELGTLGVTAATIGFLHTLCGPDHYLPFAAMSQVGGWSLRKTLVVTLLCGVGHVASSTFLGAIGIALGTAVVKLEMLNSIERSRGDFAGWFLVAFGLMYSVWGIVQAIRNRPHTHLHGHSDGTVHAHVHVHQGEHLHPHPAFVAPRAPTSFEPAAAATPIRSITPWVLFTIFLFGPCEPLIPLVMYPAAKANFIGIAIVTALFGAATLVTMLRYGFRGSLWYPVAVLAPAGTIQPCFGGLDRFVVRHCNQVRALGPFHN